MGAQQVAADSALLLLVGGLAILAFIIVLVLLESFIPNRKPAPGLAQRGPVDRLHRVTPVDRAMSHLVELDLGQPRILRASRGATRVRIYGCRSCTQDPTAATGCRHEQDRIGKVFSGLYQRDIAVREISCCRRGHGACDFEVRHG